MAFYKRETFIRQRTQLLDHWQVAAPERGSVIYLREKGQLLTIYLNNKMNHTRLLSYIRTDHPVLFIILHIRRTHAPSQKMRFSAVAEPINFPPNVLLVLKQAKSSYSLKYCLSSVSATNTYFIASSCCWNLFNRNLSSPSGSLGRRARR